MRVLSAKKLILPAFILMTLFGGLSAPIPALATTQTASPAAYTIDVQSKTIVLHATPDAATQINQVLAYLNKRPDQDTLWTVKFQPGRYVLDRRIFADRLKNVTLISVQNQGAILRKDPLKFKDEYLFYTRFSKNVTISGFDIYGLTIDFNLSNYDSLQNPVWHDQGVYFGSCNGVTVNENRFFNFGNAALRITTDNSDPVSGVNSFNSNVIRNYFRNVFQVTTTSNDTIHGGSANYVFFANTFDELRGSLKFASRTPGAKNVLVQWNSIRSSSTDGIEIIGYTDMDISKNVIQNVARHAINCYSNGRSSAGFQWGDNLSFTDNQISNAAWGFRFSADPFSDGFQPVPNKVTFSRNIITGISGGSPAIALSNGTFHTPSINNNQLNLIASKKYIAPGNSVQPTITGNTADNKPLQL